jgi:hypothetical protein
MEVFEKEKGCPETGIFGVAHLFRGGGAIDSG